MREPTASARCLRRGTGRIRGDSRSCRRRLARNRSTPNLQPPTPKADCLGSWELGVGSSSEARSQIELKDPAAARTLERTREVELSDRVSEQVDAQCRAGGRHALPAAAKEGWTLGAVPRDAAVCEQRDLERNRAIH